MTVMSILGAIKSGYSFIVKRIFPVRTELLAQQKEIAELQEQNRRQSDDLRKRDEQAEQEGNLFFARNAYWKKNETARTAYCPPCFDSKKLLIHLKPCRDNSGSCDVCKSNQDCVYDGPRPKEGDEATPIRTQSRGEIISGHTRSRRSEFRI